MGAFNLADGWTVSAIGNNRPRPANLEFGSPKTKLLGLQLGWYNPPSDVDLGACGARLLTLQLSYLPAGSTCSASNSVSSCSLVGAM